MITLNIELLRNGHLTFLSHRGDKIYVSGTGDLEWLWCRDYINNSHSMVLNVITLTDTRDVDRTKL